MDCLAGSWEGAQTRTVCSLHVGLLVPEDWGWETPVVSGLLKVSKIHFLICSTLLNYMKELGSLRLGTFSVIQRKRRYLLLGCIYARPQYFLPRAFMTCGSSLRRYTGGSTVSSPAKVFSSAAPVGKLGLQITHSVYCYAPARWLFTLSEICLALLCGCPISGNILASALNSSQKKSLAVKMTKSW